MYNFANDLITTGGVLLCAFFIFAKSLKLLVTFQQKILIVAWCLIIAFGYATELSWISPSFIRPIICTASIIFTLTLTKLNLSTIISAFLLSFGLSYVIYYISLFSCIIISMPFVGYHHQTGTHVDYNTPTYLLIVSLTFCIQLLLSYSFFRIRRLQSGFPFLTEKNTIIVALIAAGAVMFIATSVNNISTSNDSKQILFLTPSMFIIGAGIYIWIRRAIMALQFRWIQKQNNELIALENERLKSHIEQLRNNMEVLQNANHSINHRLRAMELRLGCYAEYSEELAYSAEQVQKLKQDYHDALNKEQVEIVHKSTNIKAIDDLFAYFTNRFSVEDIEFRLRVAGDIVHMTENFIPQNRLETLIGDHLEDALIAVKANVDSKRRCVLAIIGEYDGCYEFTVYDSGIDFEIDTLVRLGTEKVTTHAATGGSGTGFMQTFETMREYGASLIIDEHKENKAFTKSVTIRFDGKNQYTIKSYRASEIPPGANYAVLPD